MSFGQAVSTCFSKYGTFSGRASRSEFWWFYLLYVIAALLATFIDQVVINSGSFVSIASLLVTVVFIVPFLAVGARRLHDTSKSGWLLLLGLIPCVGGIILLVFFLMPTKPGENQYGFAL